MVRSITEVHRAGIPRDAVARSAGSKVPSAGTIVEGSISVERVPGADTLLVIVGRRACAVGSDTDTPRACGASAGSIIRQTRVGYSLRRDSAEIVQGLSCTTDYGGD